MVPGAHLWVPPADAPSAGFWNSTTSCRSQTAVRRRLQTLNYAAAPTTRTRRSWGSDRSCCGKISQNTTRFGPSSVLAQHSCRARAASQLCSRAAALSESNRLVGLWLLQGHCRGSTARLAVPRLSNADVGILWRLRPLGWRLGPSAGQPRGDLFEAQKHCLVLHVFLQRQ